MSRNTTRPPARNPSRTRIAIRRGLAAGAFTGGGCGAANLGAAGGGNAGGAIVGMGGALGAAIEGSGGSGGIGGMCEEPGACGCAAEAPPGTEASEIMRVYSLGPCCATGAGLSNAAGGMANAWVAPVGAAERGGGGGAAGSPTLVAPNPDASGSGGPWVSGGGALKNRVNSPPRGWLSSRVGAGD